jgi:beta-lactam-binding protein with PASTA domain
MKNSLKEYLGPTAYNFLWLLPFLCFLLGYQIIRFFFTVDTLVMPKLVGRHLQEAVRMLSDQNLNIRIVEEKETTEVPEGTILSQIPLEGQKIKPYQSIFLVLSQRSSTTLAPTIQGLSEAEAIQVAHERELDIKRYKIYSSAPIDSCIAQIPAKSLPLTSRKIIAYISQGEQPYRLMPNFKHVSISEVTAFLRTYKIEPQMFHGYEVGEDHICDACMVLDQRPFAGALVNLSAPFKVQLRIGIEQ